MQPLKGIVAKTSRRFVNVLLPDEVEIQASARTKAIEAVAGDRVIVEQNGSEWALTEIEPRVSELTRCYRDERVTLAANVSRVLLIASVAPRLNFTFIDRVLCSAHASGLQPTLLINKVDLGVEPVEHEVTYYQKLVDTALISAKYEKGLGQIYERLKTVTDGAVMVGMSGAGKTTLLGKLIPGVVRRVGEVSERTGFGKQTTTQAEAFWYKQENVTTLLIDSPGIQNFGVMHLTIEQVGANMSDIAAATRNCGFDNCSHRNEEDCGVVRAVEAGELLSSRYESYCNMCDEIESMKHWERSKRMR